MPDVGGGMSQGRRVEIQPIQHVHPVMVLDMVKRRVVFDIFRLLLIAVNESVLKAM